MPEDLKQPNDPKVSSKQKFNWKNILIGGGIGIVLIGLVGGGVLVYNSFQTKPSPTPPATVTPKKSASPSAKPATSSAKTPSPQADETVDWKVFTAEKYTIKYPPTWLIVSPSDSPETCDPNQAFFAPTKELLGGCGTEFGGIINSSITPSTIDQVLSNYAAEDYDDFKKENLGIINNKKTFRISGISKVKTEFFDLTGTKTVVYVVDLGDKTLQVMYSQRPTWSDYSSTFEKMVSTLKFLD